MIYFSSLLFKLSYFADIVAPATEVEKNEKYSYPRLSDYHQQQRYPEQFKDWRYLNRNKSPKYPLPQFRNPGYFQGFNQQNPLTQTGNSSEPQLRSHLGEPQMSNSHGMIDYSFKFCQIFFELFSVY